jgi:TetR/AcrR family transcriptional repressor of multidrug resistance operon
MTKTVDRPAAIRKALRDLVAERGFHGASMGAIATAAGVATGTAYVHYGSKEELVVATYLEIKQDLGEAVATRVDLAAAPPERYRQVWLAIFEHLGEEPERARFLTQMEESPFYEGAHRQLVESGDKLVELAMHQDFLDMLVPLPMEVVYALTMGVAVRLVAAGIKLSDNQLETVVAATWRAVTGSG